MQTQTTAENIAKIDEKLEALPLTESELIQQYEEEKELQMKINVNKDHLKDREIENKTLFRAESSQNYSINIDIKKVNPLSSSGSIFDQNRFAGRR